MRTLAARSLMLVLVAVGLAACGRTSLQGKKPPPGPAAVSVRIEPRDVTLLVGSKLQLTAIATFEDGTTRDVADTSTGSVWSTGEPTALRVSATGELEALTAGLWTFAQVDYQGVHDSIGVSLMARVLTRVSMTPPSLELALGGEAQVKVLAYFEDGGSEDVTDSELTHYATHDPEIASVSSTGSVRALSRGRTRVVAGYGDRSAGSDVVVLGSAVDGLTVTPDTATLAVGERLELTALARLADGTTLDVTTADNGTQYESSAPDVVRVSADGVVEAIAPGDVRVLVRHGGRTAVASMTIVGRPADLASIEVQPLTLRLNPGELTSLTVTARFTDGRTADVTPATAGTTYSSTRPELVGADGDGHVMAIAPGTAEIVVLHGGLTARVAVTVEDGAPVLQSLTVLPTRVGGRPGDQATLVVTGTYSDGRTADVTRPEAGTTYSTGNSAIAQVSADGRVTLTGAGRTQVRVRNGALEVAVDVEVEALPASLVAIGVTPSTLDLTAGESRQLAVLGRYSDGTQRDLTGDPATRFSSSQPTVATVNAQGVVTASAAGNASVRVEVGTITADVPVSVRGVVTLVRLDVQPSSLTLVPGASVTLVVSAVFSDGTLRNVTGDPATQYASGDPAIASVATGGVVTARSRATARTTVLVTYGGLTASVAVDVLATVVNLVALRVNPASLDLTAGGSAPLTVTGVYSDNTTKDLTADPATSFTSTAPAIAAVTGATVRALAAGTTNVRITNGTIGATVTVRVAPAPPVLTAIRLEPPTLALVIGDTATVRVTGAYSDGSTRDLTLDPTLVRESSAPAVATITLGTVRALGVGTTTLRAALGAVAGTSSVRVTAPPPVLVSLRLTPATFALDANTTARVTVTGTYSDGSSQDLTLHPNTTWTVAEPSIAAAAAGVLTARTAGTTTLRVSHGAISITAPVQVRPGVPVLVAIAVSPTRLALNAGASAQLTVTGTYSDGTTKDLTADPLTAFASTDPAIASVIAGGKVTAAAPGSTTLTVRNGGLTQAVPIIVSAAPLVTLEVAPVTATLDVGRTLALKATGTFADGRVMDVTPGSTGTTYQVSDATLASVTVDGVVTARAGGRVVILVTNAGKTATATLTLNAPVLLVRIVATPATATLRVGATKAVTVQAFFDDGSSRALAGDPALTFSTSSSAIAAVAGDGTITAVATGLATIRASYQGKTADVVVTVQAAPNPVVRLEFTPAAGVDLLVGKTQALTITGVHQDGTREDLTRDAKTTYASSAPAIATADAAGNVTALGPGTTTIVVKYEALSANVPVNVRSPAVTRLEATPPSVSLSIGGTQTLSVTATYEDGTTAIVTTQAGITYTSATPGIATASATGVITAVAAGNTRVRVAFGGQGVDVNVTVTTNPVVVVALDVQPSISTVYVGKTQQLTVSGIRSDGSRVDLTGDPATSYVSGTPAIATIASGGLVTGVAAGSVTVTVRYQSVIGLASVTVKAPALVSLSVAPPTVSLVHGATQNVTVTARYDDGSTQDVTANAATTYVSGNPGVITASAGKLTATGPGSTVLVVLFGGQSALVSVTVTAKVVSLKVEPATAALVVGQTLALKATATYLDGSTKDVTSDPAIAWSSTVASVASVSAAGLVTATGAGSARVDATFGGQTGSCAVTSTRPTPRLDALTPAHVLLNASGVTVRATGANFDPASVIVFDGAAIATTFGSPTELRFSPPAGTTSRLGLHTVLVRTTGLPDSNATTWWVVSSPPSIAGLYPNAGVRGTRVDVTMIGSGLGGATVTTSNPAITVGATTYSTDGSKLFTSFTIAAGAALGNAVVTVTNSLGAATSTFTVSDATSCTDLVVAANQTVSLSGTQIVCKVTIETGARVIGTGTQPLVLISTGDIIVRGRIEANGTDGIAGWVDPANGGAGGPGAGGGGGGGDGSTSAGQVGRGGAGSPAGQDGSTNAGAGTKSGNGGGKGAGQGISGGCGQAGGGGGFGGKGGNGGGDRGAGTGGAGGAVTIEGSDYGGGSGGAGGSTCGPNSGGGGGGGGGVVRLVASTGGKIDVLGAIQANGGRGGCGFSGTGNAGGGSGGLIEVISEGGRITVADTLSVRGGDSCAGGPTSGDGGGGGGGGRIVIDANGGGVDDAQGYYDLRGGTTATAVGGGFAGENGAIGVSSVTP